MISQASTQRRGVGLDDEHAKTVRTESRMHAIAGNGDASLKDFTATSSLTQLSIIGLSTAGGDYIGLDNVDVEIAKVGGAPEPGTYALLVEGMDFLWCVTRRRLLR